MGANREVKVSIGLQSVTSRIICLRLSPAMSAILLRQKLLPVPLKVTELENMKLSFNIETTDQNALELIKL